MLSVNRLVGRHEVKRWMKKMGQAVSDCEMDALMEEYDADGDGKLTMQAVFEG